MLRYGLIDEEGINAFDIFKMGIDPSSFKNFRTPESIISHIKTVKNVKGIHVIVFTRLCLAANTIKKSSLYSKFVANLQKYIHTNSLSLDAHPSKLIPPKITISKLVYFTIWQNANNKRV